MASKKRNKKKSIFARIKAFFKKIDKKRDSEYSKRLLTKIVNHSLLMMWASYALAWHGKTEIAETLSKTIFPTASTPVYVKTIPAKDFLYSLRILSYFSI